MKFIRNRWAILVVVVLILFVCFAIFLTVKSTNYVEVRSEDGVWDLQDFPFEEGNASLRGYAAYIPGALLTPEEFGGQEEKAITDGLEYNAEYVTARLRILMPNDNYYAFTQLSIDYSERVYVNGKLVLEVGSPGESAEATLTNTGKIMLTLQPQNGVVEIVTHSANFVHREGGEHVGWQVGKPSMLREELSSEFATSIAMGCFMALFLVHLVFFFLLRQYHANLFFSLFCLIWFLRTGVTGTRIFAVLFPAMEWYTRFRIEYMAFPVTAVLIVSLLDILFPNILHRWFSWAIYGTSAMFAGMFMLASPLFMSYALLVCEGIYVIAIAYCIVMFVLRFRKPLPEQIIFLGGIVIFMYATVHDMLFFNNIWMPPFTELTSICMLCLIFCDATSVLVSTFREMERAKQEEERLAAENATLDRTNRLRSDMMATMSHEMRTPLTVMSVYAQLALETLSEAGLDDQTTADLGAISREARRLADLANSALELTRTREDTREYGQVNMGKLVEQLGRLLTPMLERNENRLKLEVEANLPPVYGNAGELTQTLWNLMSNAARHTDGGVITFSVRTKDGEVEVAVADTGEGIKPGLLPEVFERHRAGDPRRTGLGLSISRDIVETHGGKITIESEPGRGTTVTFTLPAARAESQEET